MSSEQDVVEYMKEAIADHDAYLHITHHIDEATDPLDVEFYWTEVGDPGGLARVNLRDEYLEVFNDDPEFYAHLMPGVVAALRSLADEIEAIHKKTAAAQPNS